MRTKEQLEIVAAKFLLEGDKRGEVLMEYFHGWNKEVHDLRALLAAHSAGRSLPLSKEQKAALDLAVLNLKTHGDDQFLSAVTPLIEYYKSTAHSAGAQEPEAWLTPDNDLYLENPGYDDWTPLYAHPQPMMQTDAARDAEDAKRYRLLRERYFTRADNPNTSAYHCVGVFTSWMHAPTIDREGLDAVLDAEIERLDRAKGE